MYDPHPLGKKVENDFFFPLQRRPRQIKAAQRERGRMFKNNDLLVCIPRSIRAFFSFQRVAHFIGELQSHECTYLSSYVFYQLAIHRETRQSN